MSDEKTTETVTETTRVAPADEGGPLGNVTEAVTQKPVEVEKTTETVTESPDND